MDHRQWFPMVLLASRGRLVPAIHATDHGCEHDRREDPRIRPVHAHDEPRL